MGRMEYLAMKTDPLVEDLISSDINDLKLAAKKLFKDATKLWRSWFWNFFSQMGCLIFCHIKSYWLLPKLATSKLLNGSIKIHPADALCHVATSILLFVNPGSNKHVDITSGTLHLLQSSFSTVQLSKGRGWKMDCLHCSCFKAVLPQTLSRLGEMPGSLILLPVVAPNLFAHTWKNSWVGVFICLVIGCYLLQEHIRASGGFRNSFTQSHGISNTVGIIVLLLYPVWSLVLHFV